MWPRISYGSPGRTFPSRRETGHRAVSPMTRGTDRRDAESLMRIDDDTSNSLVPVVVELEHVEEIADRRHVGGNVRIVVAAPGIRQVVAAAACQRLEAPVA